MAVVPAKAVAPARAGAPATTGAPAKQADPAQAAAPANAAAPARWGEVTVAEPELAAEALAGGDVATRVAQFLRRRQPGG